jgi:DNA-binding GntR family transcriptional regulator
VASPVSAVQTKVSAGSLADRAYYAIRQLIVSVELGPGAVIDERALMERLAIGRTPIREALRRLAQEKLVDVFPRRGMFVTGVDVRDLARLTEVRVVLEPEAARLAAERATEQERSELGEFIAELRRPARLSGAALIALDERIHRAVYRCTHNQLLEATLEEYFVLALRIWYLGLEKAQELEGAVREHAALLEAIGDGEASLAAALMEVHVQSFEQAMRRVLTTPT